MNGNGYMEVHYVNSDGNFPYTGNESFVNFFEDHTHMPMNCVPAAPMHHQENVCWSMHMNPYTFGSSSYGTDSYYSPYEVNDHLSRLGISGRQWEYPSIASTEEPTRIEDTQTEAHAETSVDEYHEEGTPDDQNPNTSEEAWQDTIDPDNMTYEVRQLELKVEVFPKNSLAYFQPQNTSLVAYFQRNDLVRGVLSVKRGIKLEIGK